MSVLAPNPSVSFAPAVAGPRVVVLGNEKGGSGKSTTAMHLVVALLRLGYKVGVVDLDARQGTLSRYVENRTAFVQSTGLPLPLPELRRVARSESPSREVAESEERTRFDGALAELAGLDFLVIDTPGSDSHLSRLGHQAADVLITPLNDSFIDLDLLARIDPEGRRILGPSVYSQMVWEQRQQRARAGGRPVDWIVMRNRLSHLDARNKQKVGGLLDQLAKRIGFRLAPGFGERVIFRELFPKGLTLLDLREAGTDLTLSHLAARQEVFSLLSALGLEADPGED
ncbi:chromosome partitioning protein [Tistlia consotensis]|uniref:Chromosome partitioning protein n=1 Tax=Tistlia consotensis USBA 355 TaxID=560819 RepID=A0A1Y6B772_9PROT|nr:division plane positioning ATPase MipZ [Tistlia consotensis]SME88002.1 chromosome partitioning protein [Tistlia consotensis USBA 355]SNR24349.1 chromosome partitioning protein [Tistlia consotensis]